MAQISCIECKSKILETGAIRCPTCGAEISNTDNSGKSSGFSLETFTSSLSNKEFRWLFLSNTFSFLAMNTHMMVRSWLVIELPEFNMLFTTIDNPNFAPLALVIALMSFSLPMISTSFIGGLLADRLSRKLLIQK